MDDRAPPPRGGDPRGARVSRRGGRGAGPRRRDDRGAGARRGPTRPRQSRARRGGHACRVGMDLARAPRPGRALRRPHGAPAAGLHRRRGPVARARHRRQYRRLQPDARAPAGAPAGATSPGAGPAVRVRRRRLVSRRVHLHDLRHSSPRQHAPLERRPADANLCPQPARDRGARREVSGLRPAGVGQLLRRRSVSARAWAACSTSSSRARHESRSR